MWIQNSNGKKDAILTFLAITFAAVLGRYVLGGLTLPWPQSSDASKDLSP